MDVVEICNIYIYELIIKAVTSTTNSDKLNHNYDELYLGVTLGREREYYVIVSVNLLFLGHFHTVGWVLARVYTTNT